MIKKSFGVECTEFPASSSEAAVSCKVELRHIVAFPSLANLVSKLHLAIKVSIYMMRRGMNGEGHLEDECSDRDLPDSRGQQHKMQKTTLTVVCQRRKMRLGQVKLHFFFGTKGWVREGRPFDRPCTLLCHSPGVIFKLHFSFPHQSRRHMHHLKKLFDECGLWNGENGPWYRLHEVCQRAAGAANSALESDNTPLVK